MGAPLPLCGHSWIYSGVRFWVAGFVPGSGAEYVRYCEAYLCSRCCQRQYFQLPEKHDSYQAVRYGATPLESGASVQG